MQVIARELTIGVLNKSFRPESNPLALSSLITSVSIAADHVSENKRDEASKHCMLRYPESVVLTLAVTGAGAKRREPEPAVGAQRAFIRLHEHCFGSQ